MRCGNCGHFDHNAPDERGTFTACFDCDCDEFVAEEKVPDIHEGDRVYLFTDWFPHKTPAIVRRVYSDGQLSVRIRTVDVPEDFHWVNIIIGEWIPFIAGSGEWELSNLDK